MNDPDYQSPYLVEPGQPNFHIYKRICRLFEAGIPLVDGKTHTITKMYKDKEKKNTIQLTFDSYNDTITHTELIDKYDIESVFNWSFIHNDEKYSIEIITKTLKGLEITFKSINKNSTSGLFGAFQKSKRYSDLIPLRQDGGRRKTRHNKKTIRSKKVCRTYRSTYRSAYRHRK